MAGVGGVVDGEAIASAVGAVAAGTVGGGGCGGGC